MSADVLMQRLNAIAAAIGEAQAAIAAGDAVDLSALETAIRDVCDDIAAAPPAEGREELEQTLRRVLGDLDELAGALSEQLQRALDAEGVSAAAQSAYGKPGDDQGGGENG